MLRTATLAHRRRGADPTQDTAADTSREFETGGEPEPGLTAADQATVEALQQGTRAAGRPARPELRRRFLLDAEVTTVGRSPGSDIFLDDVTVSRKHAEFLPRRRSSRCATSAASTAPTSTASGSTQVALHAGDEVQIGKFRLLFQQSDSREPAARDIGGLAPELAGIDAANLSIGEVLSQLRQDFPDVTISKIRFLEAEGLVEPAPHAVRLPQVHPGRRRAAALHPDRAAATTSGR